LYDLPKKTLAFVKVAQNFVDAGAGAPLQHLPFVPQGVAAKLSVASMLPREETLVSKISSNNSIAIKFLPSQLLHLQHDGFVTKFE
jgi:hypothetical protein